MPLVAHLCVKTAPNALDTCTPAAQHQQHLAASLAKELTEATAIMEKSILLTGSSIL